MAEQVYNVLFLCTGNSARSVLGECLLTHMGQGRFRGYSAGSHPSGRIFPPVLNFLEGQGVETGHLRSKSWDEFATPDAPRMDFVFTVCDSAANEVCPVWPGQPITAHWGMPDPVARAADEEQARRVVQQVVRMLTNRIRLFTSLPLDSLDRMSLQNRLEEIGREMDEAAIT
ncbi:arsenate reductase ArsC [Fodinicurvata halophila]|uniref:Arsenate reductase ArsC n=1 Tax=Fodinicurvata halophila TaxID=1419723 RepID=A0ABV8UNC2_9PROT